MDATIAQAIEAILIVPPILVDRRLPRREYRSTLCELERWTREELSAGLIWRPKVALKSKPEHSLNPTPRSFPSLERRLPSDPRALALVGVQAERRLTLVGHDAHTEQLRSDYHWLADPSERHLDNGIIWLDDQVRVAISVVCKERRPS